MGQNSFNVKTSGTYESIDEIKNTVVGSTAGQLIYLKDIAEVGIDFEEKAFYDILKALAAKYDFDYPEDKTLLLAYT